MKAHSLKPVLEVSRTRLANKVDRVPTTLFNTRTKTSHNNPPKVYIAMMTNK